jgi:hypothetical protein
MFQDHGVVKMRVLAAVTAVLLALSATGIAQNSSKGTNSSKSSTRAPKSTLPVKSGGAASTSGNAKNLQNIEHETAKTAGKSEKAARAPKPVAMKPEKDRSTPINFGGKSGDSIGTTKQGNPYKGRLKQKGGGHAH